MVQLLIIAPHVDDELLGCFSFLRRHLVDKVIYISSTPVREKEALNAANFFGFQPVFLRHDWSGNLEIRDLIPEKSIALFPHLFESHPHHRRVSEACAGLGCQKILYKVWTDIQDLPKIHQPEVWDVFVRLYPSQVRSLTPFKERFLYQQFLVVD